MLSDADFMAQVLSDGGWHSQAEILWRSQLERGHGLTVHSRAATLRERGHRVECELRRENGRAVSFYRMNALSEAPTSPPVTGASLSASQSRPRSPPQRTTGAARSPCLLNSEERTTNWKEKLNGGQQ